MKQNTKTSGINGVVGSVKGRKWFFATCRVGGQQKGRRSGQNLKAAAGGVPHQSAQSGYVSAAVLQTNDVGVRGQRADGLGSHVDARVGRYAVQDDRNGTAIRHRCEVRHQHRILFQQQNSFHTFIHSTIFLLKKKNLNCLTNTLSFL